MFLMTRIRYKIKDIRKKLKMYKLKFLSLKKR